MHTGQVKVSEEVRRTKEIPMHIVALYACSDYACLCCERMDGSPELVGGNWLASDWGWDIRLFSEVSPAQFSSLFQ